MCLYFCCVSVLGKMPADLLLLTASTSAPPDLGETVIVSASALNGSAGCFQATQLVYVYLFFCQAPSCCGPSARLQGFSTLGTFFVLLPIRFSDCVHPLICNICTHAGIFIHLKMLYIVFGLYLPDWVLGPLSCIMWHSLTLSVILH